MQVEETNNIVVEKPGVSTDIHVLKLYTPAVTSYFK